MNVSLRFSLPTLALFRSIQVDGIISYEFYVRLPEANLASQLQKMREGLLLLGKKARGDIAVQRAGLVQRAKRMVVFDLSYTLITSDANELFFQAAGCGDATEVGRTRNCSREGRISSRVDISHSPHAS